METLYVKNFGTIKKAELELEDLTILSGSNAGGKGIILQLIKLIIDKDSICATLHLNNYNWNKNRNKFLELFFGEAMSSIWTKKTEIKFNEEVFTTSSLLSTKQNGLDQAKNEQLFYVPAQRVVTMSQGWPRAFGTFDIGDPFVLKQFSETVRLLMEKETSKVMGAQGNVFPKPGRIKESLRKMLDSSIFHGGQIMSDDSSAMSYIL